MSLLHMIKKLMIGLITEEDTSPNVYHSKVKRDQEKIVKFHIWNLTLCKKGDCIFFYDVMI